LFQETFKKISNISERNVNDIIPHNIKLKLQSSAVLELIDCNYVFESFSDRKPVVMQSQSKPIEFGLNVKRHNSSSIIDYRILYKEGNDLRIDLYVIQSLELMNEVSWDEYFSRFSFYF
jgi:hypothetical protein